MSSKDNALVQGDDGVPPTSGQTTLLTFIVEGV